MHDATKRFEIQILLKAGIPKARVAEIAGVSERTVHRIRAEIPTRSSESQGTGVTTVVQVSHGQGGTGSLERRPGRPSKTADFRDLVASILEAQPGVKTLEVLQRARSAGYRGGKTAFYTLVRELRPRAVRPIRRFEGFAGEFTQHDFGAVRVRWTGSGQFERVQFFGSRLKFSRYGLVALVANQRTETLVRSMADHFEQMGGIPLLAVFDRPTTAALKSDPKPGEVLEWNPGFADAMQRLGLGVDLYWPWRPDQKGSTENLVGWVKGSFFKTRQFHDRADLEAQLADWLVEVNEQRPCRATRCVPAELLAEERKRLRPLRLRPAELALRLPVSIGPTAMVEHETNKYSVPPEACGLPGTLHLFRDRVRIVAGHYRADHPRLPAGSRGSSSLPVDG